MAPKRGRARAPQNHTPALQSDYDTDAANMTDSAAAMPPRTNEELNLAVLKRHDPSVLDVIQVANFAVVYLFSPTSQQWEKCGIEGTLFVCELIPDQVPGAHTLVDRYNVIIINRKGLDNFSTDIFSTENVEITDDYVIVQVEAEDGTPQIYGLWIFSEPPPSSTADTRKVTAEKIYECAVRAERSRQVAEEEAAQVIDVNGSAHEPEELYEEDQPQYDPPQSEQQPTVGRQIAINELFSNQPQLSQAQQLQLQQLPREQQEQVFQYMHAQQLDMAQYQQAHHAQQQQAQQQQAQQQQAQQQQAQQQQAQQQQAQQQQHQQMMQQRAQQAQHQDGMMQSQQHQAQQQNQHQDQMIAMLRGQALPKQQQQQQRYQPQMHPSQHPQQPQHPQQHPDMAMFFQQNQQFRPSQHAQPYPAQQGGAFPGEYSPAVSQQQPQQQQQQQQRDVLGDLFRNAKQNHSG